MYSGEGSTPIPDPTELTEQRVAQATDQLRRELAAAIALADSQNEGVRRVFETRLAAMDEAVRLIEIWRQRLPEDIAGKVRHLQELHDERFKTVEERFSGVALQFKERDTRSERESRDNKVAVDAAFAAQKEAASEQNKSNTLAIDKSEKATAETLNKQADLFKSTTDALDGRIEDAKQVVQGLSSRVIAIESRGVVVRETQTQNNWGVGTIISIVAMLISLAGLIVVFIKIG